MISFTEFLESGYGLNKAGGAGLTPGKVVSKVVNPAKPFTVAHIATPANPSGSIKTFNKMKRRPSQTF